jgi:hypothetical protein
MGGKGTAMMHIVDPETGERFPFIAGGQVELIAAQAGAQGLGSIVSGLIMANAAGAAARKADNIANLQIAAAERAEARAVERLAPFREAGVEATGTLRDVFLGGAGAPSLSRFVEDSPMFNTLGELGERDINRQLSARGLFGSGAGLETLSDFRRKLLVDVAGQFLAGTTDLAQRGQAAAAGSANAAIATGSTTAGSLSDLGRTLTQSQLLQGEALGGAVKGGLGSVSFGAKSILEAQQFQNLLDRVFPVSPGQTQTASAPSLSSFTPA